MLVLTFNNCLQRQTYPMIFLSYQCIFWRIGLAKFPHTYMMTKKPGIKKCRSLTSFTLASLCPRIALETIFSRDTPLSLLSKDAWKAWPTSVTLGSWRSWKGYSSITLVTSGPWKAWLAWLTLAKKTKSQEVSVYFPLYTVNTHNLLTNFINKSFVIVMKYMWCSL